MFNRQKTVKKLRDASIELTKGMERSEKQRTMGRMLSSMASYLEHGEAYQPQFVGLLHDVLVHVTGEDDD